jgi:sterol 24-C-methyltransferase
MRLAEEAKKQKLDHLVDGRIADFNKLPFADSSMDGGYQIEAYCHSTDLKKTYAEAFRVLKPGAIFAGFEWVLTDKYDDNNEIHRALKKGIEEGNGLADMFKQPFVIEAMQSAGFEILEARDVGIGQDRPWYNSLGTTITIGEGFFYSAWGRWSTGMRS